MRLQNRYFSIFRRLQFPLLGLLIPYDNDKIEKDIRQSVEETVSSIFSMEDTFLLHSLFSPTIITHLRTTYSIEHF